MDKSLKRTLLSIGGALGGALITLLLRRNEEDEQPTVSKAAAQAAEPARRGGPLRAHVVDLVSDILAETYRKLRLDKERKR